MSKTTKDKEPSGQGAANKGRSSGRSGTRSLRSNANDDAEKENASKGSQQCSTGAKRKPTDNGPAQVVVVKDASTAQDIMDGLYGKQLGTKKLKCGERLDQLEQDVTVLATRASVQHVARQILPMLWNDYVKKNHASIGTEANDNPTPTPEAGTAAGAAAKPTKSLGVFTSLADITANAAKACPSVEK